MERENAFLSNKQIKFFETSLLNELQRLMNKESNKEDFSLDKNELADVLDEASINVQTQQNIRFKNREYFYMRKIKRALGNIKQGIYGLCEDCGDEINVERLKARPTAELCINCKEESEQQENNNFYQRKSKSLGKTLSELNSPSS